MRLLTISFNPHEKKYLAIAASIREAILSGQLKPQDRLPASRDLANQLNVNRHTIMAACDELVAQGYLESLPRIGYQVVSVLPVEGCIPNELTETQQFNLAHLFKSPKTSLSNADLNVRFNFAGGLPDITQFSMKVFKSHLNTALKQLDLGSLHYQGTLGNETLREQIKKYLVRARGLSSGEILITNGSQEALFIVAQAVLQGGDNVAVEKLSYPPACAALSSNGANLITIEQDEFGIKPDSLKRVLAHTKIKLLYLTPLHQYPTTVTLSPQRRSQIYQLAQQHDFLILEDDYDHEFHYRCSPLVPMAANDPDGRVIYISTFSKIMFAGARLGYVSAHPQVIEYLANSKKIINHKTECVLQQAVANWMSEGDFERHLRKMTQLYLARRDHLVVLLEDYKQAGYPITFAVPDGGMAIWLGCKRDLAGFTELAQAHGIYIQCQHDFNPQVTNCDEQGFQYLRLGFASMQEQTRLEAVNALLALLFPALRT